MNRRLRAQISRWGVSFVLANVLATLALLTFGGVTQAANPACNPATPQDASSGSTICDMSINAQVNPGVLTLANDAAATVPGTPFTLTGAAITANFSFTSVVKDHRGSTAGWALSAQSAGIKNGTTTLPLSLTSEDVTSSCTNGSRPATTFTALSPVPSASSSIFLTAGNASGTVVVDGDYTNKTNGQFTITAGSPAGAYAGSITITLANVF